MSVTTQATTLSSLPNATAISTAPGDGGLVQVVQLPGPQAVSGPLTDAQLRASAVPVSGPLTDVQLRATAVPVSGPLTDTLLRATPVPISGSVTATGPLTDAQLRAAAVPVSGPATDAQLRATPLPISGTVTVTDGAGPLSIDDAAGSLTVDAPVGTPVFVRLSDGTTAIATLPVSLAALPALAAGTNLIGQAAVPPATLAVTAVSAANTAVTCTLPAVAGQFHYISRIIIERVASAAIVGSAILTYTSTNLPGSWARTTGNAAPVGVQQKDVDEVLGSELKSSAVGTATTIVAPAAGATGIVRITVYYRAAA